MDSTEPELLDALEVELDIWRKTPFDRLLTRRDPVPTLCEIARRSDDEDRPVGLDDVRKLLIAAVAAVGNSATPGGPTGNTAVVRNPMVIREIFGLTPKSRDANVADRQQHAAAAWMEEAKRAAQTSAEPRRSAPDKSMSGHTMRKPENRAAFIKQLAIWIRNYLQPSAAAPEDTDTHLLISRPDELSTPLES